MKNFYLGIILMVLLAACAPAASPIPTQTSTLPPTAPFTFTPSLTSNPSVPLYKIVTLGSTTSTETGTGPNYKIETGTPLFTGNHDPRIIAFNNGMNLLVQQEVDSFKENLKNWSVSPIVNGSFLRIEFSQVSPPGNLLSLKFTNSYYYDGAAHPGASSRTVTYDLEDGQFLTFDNLFLPNSDYLKTISAYCIAKLKASEIGDVLFVEGAQPTADNYRNWNITKDGLLITFDAYQVAAYAAGPQMVVVPYSELQSIIDPQGPLAGYFP